MNRRCVAAVADSGCKGAAVLGVVVWAAVARRWGGAAVKGVCGWVAAAEWL